MNIFDSYIDAGQKLSAKEKKEYYCALVEYIAYGTEPDLKGAADAIWTAIFPSLEISKKRSESGAAGGNKKQANKELASDLLASKQPSKSEANALAKSKSNSKSIDKETSPNGEVKKSAVRFTPPTETEAQEYANGWIAEKGLSATFDARRFIAFYESKGWLVGKTKMTDWKSAVRGWILRDATETAKGNPTPEKPREKVYKCPECGGRVFKNTNSGKYECTACYEVFNEPI